MMRDLIIEELFELEKETNYFSLTRWRNFRFDGELIGGERSTFPFEDLHDRDLLRFYNAVQAQLQKHPEETP